jgi:hypothetical protein
MAKSKSRSPEARRAMRDKSVLDHLTSGPLKPDLGKQQGAGHEYSKREGRKLEKAIHKEWTTDKGGLPDF